MARSLELNAAGKARVVPIILDHCQWQAAPFSALQVLPRDGKAVTEWPNPAEAWNNIASEIRDFARPRAEHARGGAVAAEDLTTYLQWLRKPLVS